MVEISDVTKARPEKVTPCQTSPAETSMDSAVKPNRSKNWNPHKYFLAGQIPP